jgi:hypothetical protein
MKHWVLIVLIFGTSLVWSQKPDIGQKNPVYIIGQDTLTDSKIHLKEVVLFKPLTFSSYKERLLYYRLQRKTLKVYPYAKLAAERLTSLKSRLEKIEKKRHRKKYLRRIEKYIEGEFSEELKKLTRTEGQILVKLIHRETGYTTFELIKELRSGWRAFIYNTTASFFKISLKKKFDPIHNKEDRQIEDILQRAIARGVIEPPKQDDLKTKD